VVDWQWYIQRKLFIHGRESDVMLS
jgi:hypothetical protein